MEDVHFNFGHIEFGMTETVDRDIGDKVGDAGLGTRMKVGAYRLHWKRGYF